MTYFHIKKLGSVPLYKLSTIGCIDKSADL